MTDASGKGAETPRLALVGASSLLGRELKQQLADSGLPATTVSLLEIEELAGVLTEYGDEARVLVDAAAETMLAHDVVCFCGEASTAAEHLELLRGNDRVGLDCTGSWAADDRVFLWIPGVSNPPDPSADRVVALPSAGALVVGATVAALGKLAAGAVINLFIPASELGEPGLQELSRQTIAVLNLEGIGEGVFGRQQAFDLFPLGSDAPTAARRLGDDLDRLALPTPALNVVSAPVFHGMALSAFVPATRADRIATALLDAGLTDARRAPGEANIADEASIDSPVRVAGSSGIHLADVHDDGARGAWAWLVADNMHARATAAVGAIHALLGPLAGTPTPTV